MLVWKELAAWRRFFCWLGTPIRTLRDKLEVKKVTHKDFKNVTVTTTKGPGRTRNLEEVQQELKTEQD